VKEALLIVLDSVGIGHAPDAAEFGDEGADTLGHLRSAVPGFSLPHLDAAGLRHCEALAAGAPLNAPSGLSFGCLTERSAGKDTVTGHWELAGAVVAEPFATFPRFPDTLVAEMEALCGVSFLGNYARSGTVILEELGEEHLRTGKPILYTSADSVIQIAAHESVVPVERLHELCRRLRPLADRERIGRVIARPFLGQPGAFRRTANRHDFATRPPETILNRLDAAGIETIGVGKIGDIFSGSGLRQSLPTKNNADGCATMDRLLAEAPDRPRLIFTNLVDFDMLHGHRRDPAGYARALVEFDEWFGTLLPRIAEETLLLLTADHGNDPTWRGSDHTRERVPLLMKAPGNPGNLGLRDGFVDVAATLAEWFGVDPGGLAGSSLLGGTINAPRPCRGT
jgi:phosphopentomutase